MTALSSILSGLRPCKTRYSAPPYMDPSYQSHWQRHVNCLLYIVNLTLLPSYPARAREAFSCLSLIKDQFASPRDSSCRGCSSGIRANTMDSQHTSWGLALG